MTDDALAWARRGIAETTGWQVAKLYDLAADLLGDEHDLDGVVDLRRHHLERLPSASTYAGLQAAARTNGTWDVEIGPARTLLAEATRSASSTPCSPTRQPTRPGQRRPPATVSSRLRGGCASLRRASRPNRRPRWRCTADAPTRCSGERTSAPTVTRSAFSKPLGAATAADRLDRFGDYLTGLRERNRRRPSFMAMLDKAGLR
ncbi:MAG: hypothetical protein IPH29_06975 [Candidatus Microthrix sp.]|nr:hypothetical protein [Candidatus Microthrix sp.]